MKPSRMKSSPLVQSKRSREMPTILEQIENDELQGMGTGSNANKRESDQPEQQAAKEHRFEDVAMDEGPQGRA